MNGGGAKRAAPDEKLGIYIQVPFCQTKCTYCNFHTGVFAKGLYRPYVEAVCRELTEVAVSNASLVDTVYIGGGTPSLLEPSELERMLGAVRKTFRCGWEEVTLEADPETVADEKAAAWRDSGFNRVSLGAQSFEDQELRAAGRKHCHVDIFNAVRFLRQAGFVNVSLDLIAGLPHQTAASWKESIRQLLEIHPEHISIYLLEIDGESRLGRESLAGGRRYGAESLPDDDTVADFYEFACCRIEAAGYEHYEISNWALPGFRSRHNLKYWHRKPYLGIGAGAHSFDGHNRWSHRHDPAAYVAAVEQGCSLVADWETLTSAQEKEEELFLGLRLLEGIDLVRIEGEYGISLASRIAPLLEQRLVELEGSTLRLSPSHLTVSNEVFMELLGWSEEDFQPRVPVVRNGE